jgi:hypothetical protein
MGRACSMHGVKRNAYRILVKKSQKERDHWEELDMGVRIIQNLSYRMGWCGLN